MSRLAVAVLALAVLALAAPARAQEDAAATSVAVLPYAPLFGEVPQSTGDRATEFVANEIGANRAFKIMPVTEAGGARASAKKGGEEEIEAAKKEIAEAVALFAKAGALAKSRKMKPAADTYEKGVTKFLLNFQGAESFAPLSDAFRELVIVRFKLADEDEAVQVLDNLVRIDPDRVLTKDEVANIVATLHAKARRAYHAKERGQIRVLSTPAGARVMLDGRDLGETPLVAKDVLPGEHYLRVMKPGQGAFWKKLEVVAGEEVSLTANLAGEATGALANIAKALRENAIDEKALTLAREVGTASKAEFVLLGALHLENEAYTLKTYAVRVKDGLIAELSGLTFDIEMVGAAIEVFKLASDFGEKARDYTGVALPGVLQLFPGAQAAAASDTVNEVRVTPGNGEGAAPAQGDDRGGRTPVTGNRRVITPTEERKPIEADGTKTSEVEKPIEEPGIKSLRVRGKIGENSGPERKSTVEVVEAEPEITLSADVKKGDVIAEAMAAEEAEKQRGHDEARAKELNLDAKATSRRSDLADLSPEEIAKLEQADRENEERGGGRGGHALLYTGVGVGAAALIGTGLYFFVFRTTEPTSATAVISWQP